MENDFDDLPEGLTLTEPLPDLDLGNSVPAPIIAVPSDLPNQSLVTQYKKDVQARLSTCGSQRDVLNLEIESLAECVGIAAEIFQRNAIPDNAYMLSALQNAKNSALGQLEKMRDPKVTLGEIEGHIKNMFTSLIRALVSEIDKTKKEMIRTHPESRSTIEDQFSRMVNAVAPETNKLYDSLHGILKQTLGIKK